MANVRCALRMSEPSPSVLPTISEITIMMKANASATRIPAKTLGSAEGTTTHRMVSMRVRPKLRAVSSRSALTPRAPSTAFTRIGKIAPKAMTAIFIPSPIPSSRIPTGMIAAGGSARSACSTGSTAYAHAGLRESGAARGEATRMEDDGSPRLAVPVGPDDHFLGSPSAPVTLVEYGDFECPYCGITAPIVKELAARYGDRLGVVFRSFPLEQHRHAQAAAEAAEFAADHGKFWAMHAELYAHQHALEVPDLIASARRIGLDGDALAEALRERTYQAIVEEQKEGGEESEIPGTPAFFLNGVLFEDEPTAANLSHAIDWLLEN